MELGLLTLRSILRFGQPIENGYFIGVVCASVGVIAGYFFGSMGASTLVGDVLFFL